MHDIINLAVQKSCAKNAKSGLKKFHYGLLNINFHYKIFLCKL